MGEPPAGQGVRCFVVAGFWLREGVWDGLVEQFEGAALGGCGGGEDVGGGVGGQEDGVAGEGGEVVEQVVEGQGGEPVGGAVGVRRCGSGVPRRGAGARRGSRPACRAGRGRGPVLRCSGGWAAGPGRRSSVTGSRVPRWTVPCRR